jgi:hypothetical protein
MPGYNADGEIDRLITSSITKNSYRSGYEHRWVRERKRFDKEATSRIEARVMDLETYLIENLREVLDIGREIRYFEDKTEDNFHSLKERMD